jgi:hypothetical protein
MHNALDRRRAPVVFQDRHGVPTTYSNRMEMSSLLLLVTF